MSFKAGKILPVIGIVMFLAALWILSGELQQFRWDDFRNHFAEKSLWQISAVILLTTTTYILLGGYDYLGTRYIGVNVPYPKLAFASFLGYAFSHNISPTLVSGASARYRVYSTQNVTGFQVTQIVIFCALTLWVGFFAVGSIIFLLLPFSVPENLNLPFESLAPIGLIFMVLLITYIVLSLVIKKPLRIRGTEFYFSSPRLVIGQITVSSLDWLMSAGILYLLLPAGSEVTYPMVAGMYMLAVMSGIISQVPGGLGVFETVVLLMLNPFLPAAAVVGSLVTFRVVYYIIPLIIASVSVLVFEAIQRNKIKTYEG